MPPSKLKPSEVASEAKRTYMPFIEQKCPQFPRRSFLHSDSSQLRLLPSQGPQQKRLRVAVIDGDPVDVALDWHDYDSTTKIGSASVHAGQAAKSIPIVNMANEKRAGGDWESGFVASEENLSRRSNLVNCLNSPWNPSIASTNYPLPTKGGIYSPYVGK